LVDAAQQADLVFEVLRGDVAAVAADGVLDPADEAVLTAGLDEQVAGVEPAVRATMTSDRPRARSCLSRRSGRTMRLADAVLFVKGRLYMSHRVSLEWRDTGTDSTGREGRPSGAVPFATR